MKWWKVSVHREAVGDDDDDDNDDDDDDGGPFETRP
jgi:hypothetical protein